MKFYILILSVLLCQQNIIASGGLRTSPRNYSFNLNSDTTVTRFITVTNISNIKTSFVASIVDFDLDSTGKVYFIHDTTHKHSCKEWMQLIPSSFSLNPNESTQLSFQFSIPKNDSSSRWSSIAIETVTEQNKIAGVDKTLKLGMTVSVGTKIMVTRSSPKNNVNSGELVDFKVTKDEENGTHFTFEGKNTGSTILQSTFITTISNLETAEETTLEPLKFKVHPNGKIIKVIDLPKGILKGTYEVTGIFDFGNPDKIEGKRIPLDIK